MKLHIEITTTELDALRSLAKSGLYGQTAEEAAERLIAEKVRQLIQDGALQL